MGMQLVESELYPNQLGSRGDDYVTKPFLPLEVVARIRVHLRRGTIYSSSVLPSEKVFDYGIFSLNRTTGQFHVNHEEVSCPAKEFELLHYFCSHPNRVFTAQQLYEQVWGNMVQGDEKTVVIDISRLRRKLETNPSNPRIIVTIRGIGYKFIPPYGE
ncbi:response regulator transcription factor [Paenibacillus sp. WST5]|uniref:Response regulator transcription factor n=2 Tax=Paenibacillus sedimenti TaxID=2770274 RepID=A0A926KVQ7_9BACL|nr:response regulator transcription factor [Paenibacillus sedimenti]